MGGSEGEMDGWVEGGTGGLILEEVERVGVTRDG